MPEYDDTNHGALFKNDKGDNDKRPDYRGPLDVEGVEYEMAAWIRTSKNGMKYMSINIQEPRQKEEAAKGVTSSDTEDDSDIPF